MKKLFFSAMLVLPFLTNAQDKAGTKTTTTTTTVTTEMAPEIPKQKTRFDFKNEVKINAFNLIIGALDLSYERLINEESSFGIRALTVVDDDFLNLSDGIEYTRVDGFYRHFFGRKPAAGFFVEGFGGFNSFRYEDYNFNTDVATFKKVNAFGLGIGIGTKFVTRKNLVFEINSGLGRNLISNENDSNEIIGRFGISVGYRF